MAKYCERDHVKNMILELEDMFSRKTIEKFSGENKKVYLWSLCGIFLEILIAGKYNQMPFYGFAKMQKETLGYIKEDRESSFTSRTVYGGRLYKLPITVSSSIDLDAPEGRSIIINFARNYLSDLKQKNKRLYKLQELQDKFEMKQFYNQSLGIPVKPHHWIDINFDNTATVTMPEFINYCDLINIYNIFVEKFNQKNSIQDELLRVEIDKELNSLTRQIIINSITFFESYLFYYFYNQKFSESISQEKIKSFLTKNKVEDDTILKQLVFRLHEHIKKNQEIQLLKSKIKAHSKVRNQLIHASALTDESSSLSNLEHLIDMSEERFISAAQDCYDFIFLMDSLLPKEEKILFWINRFEKPDFTSFKKISLLNKNRKIH
ncbi:hypothetical protein [Shouchella lehensis]|uniref:Uncharacterized protein n=1 Tax=Shouchella lehensis TaxID=300825 RepID=A0A4Y7WIM5_9BACI|nr:hypothetical protein [Shouchella lehensis]MBG9785639.1 hypothetical protein [Shouchella lehensis]TES48096.1 hypothetical protein E2L03_13255 [Shouchella lehensis]